MCYVLLGCNEKEISGSITEFLSQYCQFAVKCPRACCLSESTTDQLSEFHFQYKKLHLSGCIIPVLKITLNAASHSVFAAFMQDSGVHGCRSLTLHTLNCTWN